jgi:hypothetical protein
VGVRVGVGDRVGVGEEVGVGEGVKVDGRGVGSGVRVRTATTVGGLETVVGVRRDNPAPAMTTIPARIITRVCQRKIFDHISV